MEIEKLIIFDGELSQTFQRLLQNTLISRMCVAGQNVKCCPTNAVSLTWGIWQKCSSYLYTMVIYLYLLVPINCARKLNSMPYLCSGGPVIKPYNNQCSVAGIFAK